MQIEDMNPIYLEMAKSVSLPLMVADASTAQLPAEPAPGLRVSRVCGRDRLALLSGSFAKIVMARKAAGQTPYIATLDGEPVAYAWVATRLAHIGEAGISFKLPQADRYLCEIVVTDPCGADLVPEVLRAVIRREGAGRIWALAGCYHGASLADLERAGFEVAAALDFASLSRPRLRAAGRRDVAEAAAEMLQVPLTGRRRSVAPKAAAAQPSSGPRRQLVA